MGQYLEIYANWLPYAMCADKRGFISRRFGGNHTGVDSVCNLYTAPISPIFDGVVTAVEFTAANGQSVSYQSIDGRVVIRHLHLQKGASVVVGQNIFSGKTVLGYEGSTGSNATGKHLHTSLWLDGKLIDPEEYLAGKKALFSSPPVGEGYQVGDRVIFSTGYLSPDAAIKEHKTVEQLGKNQGVITEILAGKVNPYEIDDGFCWLNAGDIRGFYQGEGAVVWERISLRRAIRNDLNVRTQAGVSYPSRGMIQKNSIFAVQSDSQRTVNGAQWARVLAVLQDGKCYEGWSNIGETWSAAVAQG